tara:strand:- start:2644 stop:3765 length:1122 start_codon:yes stop_codon:yes gene_type:complete
MVFSKLLDNLYALLSPKDNKEPSPNNQSDVELVNELQQGMALLSNRKQQVDMLKNRMKLIENLDGFAEGKQRLKTTSQKELQLLQKLEQDYNRKLTSYSTSYKTFMTEYQKGVNDVKKCKSDCIKNIPRGSSAWSFKRQSCQAGCDLKGPYVQPCENTFKKSRIGQAPCDTVTKGRCENGNVVLGAETDVTSSSYADSNNVTIKDGCCACGGGAGGPPSTMVRGKKITNCNQISGALGYQRAQPWVGSACNNARVDSFAGNKSLHIKYGELANQNQDLISTAQKIFDKIQQLNKTDLKIQNDLDTKDFDLKNQLAEYGTLYADIIARQGKKDQTIDGQLEDIRYKEDSQQLQFLIWTGLAILTILFAIQRMRK